MTASQCLLGCVAVRRTGLLFIGVLVCLAACDSGDWFAVEVAPAPSSVTESMSQVLVPTQINLYPVSTTQENPARLFVMVTGIGAALVNLPPTFDAGSAGITLNALNVFPETIVDAAGFRFPPGTSAITYQGITNTDRQATRMYGGAMGRTEFGNVGFATVSIGDAAGTLTARSMPVFLYYAVELSGMSEAASPQQQQVWFGVNDAMGPAEIEGYSVCQAEISGSTIAVSGGDSFAGPVLFDTGTPWMQFNVAPDVSFPSDVSQNTPVTVTTPSGFVYGFSAGPPGTSSPDSVDVQVGSAGDSIVGISYFTTNSFFIDYVAGTEGWR